MIAATVVQGPGAPRVRVTSSVGPVYAVVAGVRRQVRGSVVSSGVESVDDFEQSPGVPVAYTNGTETTAEVVVPEAGYLWLIPCDEPGLAAEMVVEKSGVSDWSYAETRSQLDIPGGAPVVVATPSKARSGSLTVLGLTRDEKDALTECLRAPGVHFVSVSEAFWPWHGVAYVAVSEVVDTPRGTAAREAWQVSFTATEVDRPVPAMVRPTGWEAMPTSWDDMPDTWAGMP